MGTMLKASITFFKGGAIFKTMQGQYLSNNGIIFLLFKITFSFSDAISVNEERAVFIR